MWGGAGGTVGWRLRKALDARDGGCRFPGCGSRVRTHAHHIVHWAHGGETAMHNLVLLCPFHHRAVHEGGWRVEMDERGVPNFFNPRGVRMPVVPEAPDIGDLVPAAAHSLPEKDFGLARWHGRRGNRSLDRNHAMDGRTHRLGLGNGVPLGGGR